MPKNPSLVRRIVVARPGAPEVLFEAPRRKGPRAPLAKEIGKRVERLAAARQAAAGEYLERHAASEEKRRNGWLRDLRKNVEKAAKAGSKELPERPRPLAPGAPLVLRLGGRRRRLRLLPLPPPPPMVGLPPRPPMGLPPGPPRLFRFAPPPPPLLVRAFRGRRRRPLPFRPR